MSNINIIILTVFLVKIYPFGQPHPIILVKLICITNSSIIDEPIYKSPVYLSIDNINIRHFIINQLSLIFLHFYSEIKILIKIHIDKVVLLDFIILIKTPLKFIINKSVEIKSYYTFSKTLRTDY